MNAYSENIHYITGTCSLGTLLVATSSKGVCAILMADTTQTVTDELLTFYPWAQPAPEDISTRQALEQVSVFIDNPATGVTFPLDIRGTDFQQRVWRLLSTIPAGETRSYQQIATLLGDIDVTRAVAGACAANVLAVALPCHRVVRKDGSLSGYRWGVERKRQLLNRESQR